jgi:hypothetical protein
VVKHVLQLSADAEDKSKLDLAGIEADELAEQLMDAERLLERLETRVYEDYE